MPVSVKQLPPPKDWREAAHRIRHMDLDGRALEVVLILVKYTYAVMFVVTPKERVAMIAMTDIVWVPGYLIALPFLFAAGLSTIGMVQNALGYDSARRCRIWGATVGMMIWIFILIGNHRHGYLLAGLTPWCIWAGIFGSIWIIRRGKKGVPGPGVVVGEV